MATMKTLLAEAVSRQQEFLADQTALDAAAKTHTIRQFIHSKSSKGQAENVQRNASAASSPDNVVSKAGPG